MSTADTVISVLMIFPIILGSFLGCIRWSKQIMNRIMKNRKKAKRRTRDALHRISSNLLYHDILTGKFEEVFEKDE